jgi:hypothetical protein
MKRYFESKPKLYNREYGKKAFILGNGPSILKEDLTKLSDHITIGMNASTLLEKENNFIQTYYCLSDARFINHPNKRELATSSLNDNTLRILRKDLRSFDDNSLNNKTYYIPHIDRDGFSCNLNVGFYYGCSTTMLAVQLAFYLGCQDVFLIGVDLKYPLESPRFYEEESPQIEDSFTSVQIWNLANAANVYTKTGRNLINCSKDSFIRPYIKYQTLSESLND